MLTDLVFEIETLRGDFVIRPWRRQRARESLWIRVQQSWCARRRIRDDLRLVRVVALQILIVVGLVLAVEGSYGQIIGQVTRVLQDVCLGASRRRHVGDADVLGTCADIAGVGASGVIVVGQCLIGHWTVANCSEFQAMIVGDVPVEFREVACGRILVVSPAVLARRRAVRCFRNIRLFVDVLFCCHEHEQLVLDDWAADITTVLCSCFSILTTAIVKRAIGSSIGRIASLVVVHILRLGAEAVRLDADHSAGFPSVSTALGRDVDDAANRTAEFRTEAAGQDLRLRDCAERQFRRAQLCQRIGDREAVDVVRVLGSTTAAEAGAGRITRVGTGGVRSQLDDGVNRLRNRQVGQLFRSKCRAVIGARHVDLAAATAHRHGLDPSRRRCHEGCLDTLTDQHIDLRGGDDCTAAHDVDFVMTDRQCGCSELAGCVRRDDALQTCIDVVENDGSASLLTDRTEDVARCIGLCQCGGADA